MIDRLSVGARLAGGFAVLMALAVVQGALTRHYLATLNDRVEQLYSREVVAIKEIAQAKSDLYSLRLEQVGIAAEADAGAVVQALFERVEQAKARLASWAERYRAAAVGPVEAKLAALFAGHFKIFAHHLEEALRLGGRGPGALSAEGEQAYAKAQALLNDIVHFNDHSALTRQQYAAADYQTSKIVLFLGALFFVLSCAIAVAITKSVTRPLREVVHMADRVAAGDLTVSAGASSPDELGRVLDAMRNMTAQLAALVHKVRDCSGSIAESADWLKASSTEAAGKTEQQASALEETASSIEELTTTVKQNAEHSAEATRLIAASIAATRETASNGATVMDAVAENMELTYTAAQKIAGISNVISDIAFQTNVLSLNATIEAARAGERGRGFAVVAAEVRNLAARSAAAASDVTRLITDSLSKASAGKGLVAQAVGRMNEVVQQVNQASSVLENVALVSAEQSQGIAQINDAINEIDRITQDNLRSVEDTATAAGALAENASALEAAVASFKLKHAVSNPSPEPAPSVVDYDAFGRLQGAA